MNNPYDNPFMRQALMQQASASLQPPESFKAYARMEQEGAVQRYKPEFPINYPMPWLVQGAGVGTQFRRYGVQQLVDGAINTEVPRRLQFDIPCIIYGWTGAAVPSNGDALPNGMNPLDTFEVRLENANGDRTDTVSEIASSILGTGQRPSLIGGSGMPMDRGSVMQVAITPRRANLRISVVAWVLELRGPVNFNPNG